MKAFAFALPWSRRTASDKSIHFAVAPAVFSSYQFSRTRFTGKKKKQQSWSGQALRVLIMTVTAIETVNVTTRLDLGPGTKISCTTDKMIKFTPLRLQSTKTWNHLLSVHFLYSMSKRSSHCVFYWPFEKEEEEKKRKNSQQVWHVVLWSTRHSQRSTSTQVMRLCSPAAICLTEGFIIVSKPAAKTKLPCQSSCPASLSNFAGSLPLQVLLRHLLGAAGLARTSPPSPFSCFLKITSGGKLHSRRAGETRQQREIGRLCVFCRTMRECWTDSCWLSYSLPALVLSKLCSK